MRNKKRALSFFHPRSFIPSEVPPPSLPPMLPLLLSLTIAAQAPKATDWPQWRGPDRTGVSRRPASSRLGPRGARHGCGSQGTWRWIRLPVVVGGKVYGLGKIDNKEYAWCLNEADGSPVWSKDFAVSLKGVGYDEGPRCTPTSANGPGGGVLYILGVGGGLVA